MPGISTSIWKKLSDSIYPISWRVLINVIIIGVLSAVIVFIIIVAGFHSIINTIPFCIDEVAGVAVWSFLVGVMAGAITVYSTLKRFLKTQKEESPE